MKARLGIAGWFDAVPACRLASFRVCIAVSTLLFHLPHTARMIETYAATSFHLPMQPWVPPLPTMLAGPLVLLRYAAAAGLLVGILPRLSAAFLALSGAYVFMLDEMHYSHHVQFHLLLLFLLAFSRDRLPLPRLMRPAATEATCPAWPERLIRLQVVIVFAFTALDKAFSPAWGLSGARISALDLKHYGRSLRWLETIHRALVFRVPALFSIATILVEFAIPLALLVRRLRPLGVGLLVLFAVYLEFAVEQNYFAWDMLAAALVFLPAGDRSYAVQWNGSERVRSVLSAILLRLDWLRRLQRVDASKPASANPAWLAPPLNLITPSGRQLRGWTAAAWLVLLLAPPMYIAASLARFVLREGLLGRWQAGEPLFLGFGVLLLFWTAALWQQRKSAAIRTDLEAAPRELSPF